MKTLLFLPIIFFATQAFCQDIIPDPEFPSRPYYLKNGKLENLEKAEAKFDTKTKGLGYGGYDAFYSAFNIKSTVRFNATDLPRFYIKFEGNVDPEDLVAVSVAEILKDRRRFKTASATVGGKARDVNKVKVKLSLKKVSTGIYQIIFDSPLTPGEYAFMPNTEINLLEVNVKANLFCFGVD